MLWLSPLGSCSSRWIQKAICYLKMCGQCNKLVTKSVTAFRCFKRLCNASEFRLWGLVCEVHWYTPEFFIAGTCGLVPLQNACSCKWDWPTDRDCFLTVTLADAVVRNLSGPLVWLLFFFAGVSCDACLKGNFRGRRFKCLICYDYDLCASCYESGATTTRHTIEHPMQCILTRVDYGKDLSESTDRNLYALQIIHKLIIPVSCHVCYIFYDFTVAYYVITNHSSCF